MSFLRGHWIAIAVAAGLGLTYLLVRSRQAAAALPASVSPADQASLGVDSGVVSGSGGGDLAQPLSFPLPGGFTLSSSPYSTSTPAPGTVGSQVDVAPADLRAASSPVTGGGGLGTSYVTPGPGYTSEAVTPSGVGQGMRGDVYVATTIPRGGESPIVKSVFGPSFSNAHTPGVQL